jgi:hypothetical protein
MIQNNTAENLVSLCIHKYKATQSSNLVQVLQDCINSHAKKYGKVADAAREGQVLPPLRNVAQGLPQACPV